MTTKDIRTAHVHVTCDVCGRTLLRGEHAETYLAGGARREVCDLCAARAVHEGWVREGVALERGPRGGPGERRRPLLGRLRRLGTERGEPAAPGVAANGRHERGPVDGARARHLPAASEAPREVRQVRAVPTSAEQRTAAAIERFNATEHPRTVAGVARSLGAPVVVARPRSDDGGVVTIVVSWELCWYRYEVDLSGDGPGVRAAGQGYELGELEQEDCAVANAVADEYGTLTPA